MTSTAVSARGDTASKLAVLMLWLLLGVFVVYPLVVWSILRLLRARDTF